MVDKKPTGRKSGKENFSKGNRMVNPRTKPSERPKPNPPKPDGKR